MLNCSPGYELGWYLIKSSERRFDYTECDHVTNRVQILMKFFSLLIKKKIQFEAHLKINPFFLLLPLLSWKVTPVDINVDKLKYIIIKIEISWNML